MKLQLNFDYFRSVLNGVSSVLKNANIDNAEKNIIFSGQDEGLNVYAFSTIVTSRTDMDNNFYNLEIEDEEDVLFQLPFTKLSDFLNTFAKADSTPSSVTITRLNEYEYSVKVTEEVENIDGGIESSDVDVIFNTRAVNARVLNNLDLLAGFEGEDAITLSDTDKMRFNALITDLLPYVPERIGKGSVLSFNEDKVEVNLQYLSVSMKNPVQNFFSKGTLTHPALSVIRDVVRGEDVVNYLLDMERSVIVLESGDKLVAVRYDARPIKTRNPIEGLEPLNQFGVSRKYLESLMERLAVVGGSDTVSLTVSTENSELSCSTPNYASKVGVVDVVSTPVTGLTEGLNGVNLNIQLQLLKESLVGSLADYSEEIVFTVYSVKHYLIVRVSDTTEIWNSVFKTA